jgi:SAM-dependent methyltransferase
MVQNDFWELKFRELGTTWKFEPCDSAIKAKEIFKNNKIKNILIPGVGYGRNAGIFYEDGFRITGIEISQTAISLAKQHGFNFKIHHGSVTSMPFDKDQYDGIFCYALLHLLNKNERKVFLQSCYNQLKKDGLMVFSVVSTLSDMFAKGRRLSKNRFEINKGLNVYFYDSDSIVREFADVGMIEHMEIDEPIKFAEGYDPLKCWFIVCRKTYFML